MDVEFCLAWLRAHLVAAEAIPSEVLLLVCAIALLLLAIFIVAWLKAALRAHTLANEIADFAAEAATSRRALDTERKWRLVAEKTVMQAARPPQPEPLPPRERSEILDTGNLGPIQPAPAEGSFAQAAEPTNGLESRPAKELLELPERENLPPIQPAAKVTIKRNDVGAAVEHDRSRSPSRDEPETPSAASGAGGKRGTPAKTKSSRHAAKVAGLINRTILK
jgi:hypothetical protein